MRSIANPYIVGQFTLLLGMVSLGLTVLPPALMAESPDQPSFVGDQPEEVMQRVRPFRVASMAVAIVGLTLGPLGWLREKPPLLPISGMCLCSLALFWYWIVLGIVIAALIFGLALLSGGFSW